jgi:integrase
MAKGLPEGISLRHARSCPSRSGGRCRCAPTYQAQAWSPRDRKRLTRTFPTLAAARGWRYDALVGLRHGTLRAASGVTLREAADERLAAAQAAIIRNRSGDVYKPSATSSRSAPACCRRSAAPSSATSGALTSSGSSTG